MNSKILLVVCLYACVALTIAGGGGGKKGKDMLNCKGEAPANMKNFTTHWKDCEKEIKDKAGNEEEGEEDKMKKIGKFIETKVCMWEKMKVYNPTEGKIDENAFSESLKNMYPTNGAGLVQALKDGKCLESDKITNLSKDDHCKSFHGFLKCLMTSMHQFCHPKGEEGGDEE